MDALREFGLQPEDQADIIRDVITVVPDTPAVLMGEEEHRVVTLAELKELISRKLKAYGARRLRWRFREGISLDTRVTHFVCGRSSRDLYLYRECPERWGDTSGELGELRIEPSYCRDLFFDVLMGEGIKYTWSL